MTDIDLDRVREFRAACLAGGYQPLSVETRGKKPVAKNWTSGESEHSLLSPTEQHANTGLLLQGLRVIDVDVDDPSVTSAMEVILQEEVPSSALWRGRNNSSRFAVVVRAESVNTNKLKISGNHGSVEVLGSLQQLLTDGLHPSGADIQWRDGRSPAAVPASELPILTEAQVWKVLQRLKPLLGNSEHSSSQLPKGNPNSELGIGLDSWFSQLSPPQMADVVTYCLGLLDNTNADPRERWLNVVFAMRHVEELGCEDARQLALEWSKRGRGWTGEEDFNKAWDSYRSGRISVGTLLYLAKSVGADFSPFRNLASTHGDSSGNRTPASAPSTPKCFISPVRLADLSSSPEKREWLHGTDLIRGAVSLLVGQGGRGKSTWLIHMALACATGRSLLGAIVFGGPLRVLYINAEDSTEELNRRFSAAMLHHGIGRSFLDHLRVAGAEDARFTLLEAEKGLARFSAEGWQAFHSVLTEFQPDVVMIDPLVAVVGGASLNDNSAAAMMMQALTKTAVERRCGIVIAHHTSKGTDVSNQEAAMGAVSLVNMSRISLAVKTLEKENAAKIGVSEDEHQQYFKIVGAKQNLSRGAEDRWFKIVAVRLDNAMPPTYPKGDEVAVVERFMPTSLVAGLSPKLLAELRDAVRNANPPLSPSRKSQLNSAASKFAEILSKHRNRPATNGEGQALVKELLSMHMIMVVQVTVARSGRGGYSREGLAVVEGIDPPHNAKHLVGDDLVIDGLEASSDATKQ